MHGPWFGRVGDVRIEMVMATPLRRSRYVNRAGDDLPDCNFRQALSPDRPAPVVPIVEVTVVEHPFRKPAVRRHHQGQHFRRFWSPSFLVPQSNGGMGQPRCYADVTERKGRRAYG